MTELSCWSDLLLYLTVARRRYQGTPELAVVDYELANRRSLVFLRPVPTSPAPDASTWLSLSVQLCSERELVMRAALVTNLVLRVGALGVTAGKVVLQQTLPFGGLLVVHLEQAMGSLVKLAHEIYRPTLREDDPYGYMYR